MSLFLGVDTSNYTTSISVTDEDKNVVCDIRRLLDVKEGARGLRQSDALFLHIKNLPELFESCEIDLKQISAVGVSAVPRNVDGSYMPVFLGGTGAARMIAKTLGVPCFEFSHQEGHIKAGLFSSGLIENEFYAVHISGGTTEILDVKKTDARYRADIVGKTLDISAGQLIDRIGVKLGMSFPCGKALDEICTPHTDLKKAPVCVKGAEINFSGTETHFLKIIEKGEKAGDVANLVFSAVADGLYKATSHVFKVYGRKKVLFVGGVASNSLIKSVLCEKFGQDVLFCSPKYSTDNAVGISLMTGEVYNGKS